MYNHNSKLILFYHLKSILYQTFQKEDRIFSYSHLTQNVAKTPSVMVLYEFSSGIQNQTNISCLSVVWAQRLSLIPTWTYASSLCESQLPSKICTMILRKFQHNNPCGHSRLAFEVEPKTKNMTLIIYIDQCAIGHMIHRTLI